VIKVKKLHGVDMKKVMDLQEIAEKLKELPKEELLYIWSCRFLCSNGKQQTKTRIKEMKA